MNGRFVKYSLILLAAIGQIAFAGPPEPPEPPKPVKSETKAESLKIYDSESAKKLSEITKQHAESLLEEASKMKITIETQHKFDLDSIKETSKLTVEKANQFLSQAMEALDTMKLPSFKEIIIDENGVIKARTDTGLIIIDQSLLDSLLPEEAIDTTGGGRRQINSWGKNVVVDEDMRINSDIQVIRANVTVKGTVNGDVMTVGGDIYVTSTGAINGNAVAIGGRVKKDDGARVSGATMQMKLPLMTAARGSAYQIILGVTILVILLGLLFAWLMVALVPIPMGRISQQLISNPLKSFLFGYIFYIGLPIAWVLLLVTILGIPIALLVMPLAFPLVIVQAYAAINLAVGQKLFKKTNPLQAFLFGGMVTTVIPLLMLLIGYVSNALPLFVINMIFLGFFLFIFIPFGLGAALNSRFGIPRKDKAPDATPTQVNI
jgi:hypothetical protein